MRSRTVLAALLVTAPLVGQPLAAPSYATGSVCGSLPRCHVVTRTDVDGDGRRDVVAIARRGADGAVDGSATVLVRTSPSHVASATRGTFQWVGPLWLGAAHLDGRDGRELVLGSSAGVHTRYFRVLTWRHGTLVTLRAPGGAPTWIVDSGNAGVMGWQRTAADPVGLVRRRVAQTDPATARVTGRVTTYLWSGQGWLRVRTRVVDPVGPRLAGSWAFWHVPGLDVY
jgi:hypothetical protein